MEKKAKKSNISTLQNYRKNVSFYKSDILLRILIIYKCIPLHLLEIFFIYVTLVEVEKCAGCDSALAPA